MNTSDYRFHLIEASHLFSPLLPYTRQIHHKAHFTNSNPHFQPVTRTLKVLIHQYWTDFPQCNIDSPAWVLQMLPNDQMLEKNKSIKDSAENQQSLEHVRKHSLQPDARKNTHTRKSIDRLPRLRRHTPDRWNMLLHILSFIKTIVASNINYLLVWGRCYKKRRGVSSLIRFSGQFGSSIKGITHLIAIQKTAKKQERRNNVII